MHLCLSVSVQSMNMFKSIPMSFSPIFVQIGVPNIQSTWWWGRYVFDSTVQISSHETASYGLSVQFRFFVISWISDWYPRIKCGMRQPRMHWNGHQSAGLRVIVRSNLKLKPENMFFLQRPIAYQVERHYQKCSESSSTSPTLGSSCQGPPLSFAHFWGCEACFAQSSWRFYGWGGGCVWLRDVSSFKSRLGDWSMDGNTEYSIYLIVGFCFNQHNQQFNWRAGVHTHAWCTGFHLRNNCSETTPPHSSETTPQHSSETTPQWNPHFETKSHVFFGTKEIAAKQKSFTAIVLHHVAVPVFGILRNQMRNIFDR